MTTQLPETHLFIDRQLEYALAMGAVCNTNWTSLVSAVDRADCFVGLKSNSTILDVGLKSKSYAPWGYWIASTLWD
jgi:hypothetical protein